MNQEEINKAKEFVEKTFSDLVLLYDEYRYKTVYSHVLNNIFVTVTHKDCPDIEFLVVVDITDKEVIPRYKSKIDIGNSKGETLTRWQLGVRKYLRDQDNFVTEIYVASNYIKSFLKTL